MQGALPVNQIDNPIQKQTGRSGDGSFESDLKKAENDLIDLIFGLMPLNLEAKEEEFDPRSDEKKSGDSKTEKKEFQSGKQRQSSAIEDKKTLVVSDVKVIKEALVKFMPNPVNPIGIMPFTLNPTSGKPAVSREDLQLLIDKIVEQAKLVKTQKKTELSLLLQEKDLGKISLSLTSRDGFVSILISAPEEMRKNLQKNISELEIALKSANIDVDKLKIMGVKNEQLFSSGD